MAGNWTRDLCLTKFSYQGLVKQNDPTDSTTIGIGNDEWKNYESYLSTIVNKHTASCRLSYSKKYAYVLVDGDARDIQD